MIEVLKAAAVVGVIALMVAPGPRSAAASSHTPSVHYGGHSLALKEALLTTGDMRVLPGAPADIRVGAVDKTKGLYDDPDPRLPCGRKAPTIETGDAVGEE